MARRKEPGPRCDVTLVNAKDAEGLGPLGRPPQRCFVRSYEIKPLSWLTLSGGHPPWFKPHDDYVSTIILM